MTWLARTSAAGGAVLLSAALLLAGCGGQPVSEVEEATGVSSAAMGCGQRCSPEGARAGGTAPCCDGLSPVAGYCVKGANACLAVDAAAVGRSCGGGPSPSCCQALAQFQARGCGCSALVNALTQGALAPFLDANGQVIAPLASYCGGIGAPIGACTRRHTYNHGQCQASDDQIDLGRFSTVIAWNTFNGQEGSVPFNPSLPPAQRHAQAESMYQAMLATYTQLFEPDANQPYVVVPYGAGKYVGVTHIAEYASIAFPVINAGVARLGGAGSPVLYFKQDGAIVLGVPITGDALPVLDLSTTPPSYHDGMACTSSTGYFENEHGFQGCNTRMHSYRAVGGPSEIPWQRQDPAKYGTTLPAVINDFIGFAQSNRWGPPAICETHQTYCFGTPSQQYRSYKECLKFMRKLPLITRRGVKGAFGGDSLTCRYKHSLMVPLDPTIHCPHIGRSPMRDACIDAELDVPGVLGPNDGLIEPDICKEPALYHCIEQQGGLFPSKHGHHGCGGHHGGHDD